MDALLKLLLELLLLSFGGGSGGVKGSLLLDVSFCENGLVLSFSLCENGLVLSFSLGNGSLNSLVYRSLLLFLEVFRGNCPKL